jgi:tRNA (cytidine/uridine-2'-O-)-methyltransferase
MNHIVLFHPEIPQNTGNIMRTAMAIGAHLHIIGPLPFKINDQTLKRTGLDYIDHLKYFYYESYRDFISKHSHPDIFCVTRYGELLYSQPDYTNHQQDYYFMFGSENSGIDPQILDEHKLRRLRIPMVPLARSLNLANAVALVMYEVLRQQGFDKLATKEVLKSEASIQKKLGQ